MEYCRLGDLCTAIIDCPHTTPEWKDHGVRVIRNFNLNGGILDFTDGWFVDEETYKLRTKRAQPQPGDIVISREAPVGAAAMIPSGLTCCLGQRLVLLRADRSRVSPEYLLFALMSEYVKTQLRRADSTGSVVSNLCIPDLKEIIVPVNDHAAPEGIRLLTNINAKLALDLKLCEALMRQMSLIYDLWFGAFDFPGENGAPYRSSGGKMEWSSLLSQEIPAGWEVRSLLDIATWNGGSQPPKSCHINEPRPGYVRFIQNRDYSGSDHLTYIPESRRNKLCDEFDIMLDKYGEAGKPRFGIAGAYNVALSRIGVSGEDMQEYVRGYLGSRAVRKFLAGSSMASTRPSLNLSNLSMLNIAIPPAEVLARYERLGKSCVRRILALKKEQQQLERLRDRLITPVIMGEK